MNIALPAFLIFLILLPGFILHASYSRTEGTRLNHTPFSRITAIAVILSALLHSLWVSVTECFLGKDVDLETVAVLLVSNRSNELDTAIGMAAGNIPQATWYFLSLYIVCWLLGTTIRFAIVKYKLDRKFVFLRFDTPWFYQFRGYEFESALTYVAAVVDVSGQPVMYWGLLHNFYFDRQGHLNRLVLRDVIRGPFDSDEESGFAGGTSVDGEETIIPYEKVSSLVLEYAVLEEVDS